MDELVDWLHHESITRAATNTASSYVRQDHHLPHGSLEPHITNGDRIRQMTDEELADFMAEIMYCVNCWKFDKEQGICTRASGCNSAMLDWLRKEADE